MLVIVIVVKEKSGPATKYDLWKVPTGLLDPNEYVNEGAKLELYQERSLNATSKNILSISQSHRKLQISKEVIIPKATIGTS